ncbi:uncharacterized protein V5649_005170 [Rhynchonycteris naso]
MLAMCQVLSALAISAQKHLGTRNDEVKGTDRKVVSIMAYLTLRILFNRWSFNGKPQVAQQVLAITSSLFSLMPSSKLKNEVNRLTQGSPNFLQKGPVHCPSDCWRAVL